MKTLLDEFYTGFLHAAFYTEGELRIIVAEGFREVEPEDVTLLNLTFNDAYAINRSDESRMVEVFFSKPIAWQIIDESYTSANEYEVYEEKFAVQVLSQSRYLDYVRANHGWFKDVGRGTGVHYRLWTENEVIDVVACEPPKVGTYEGHKTNK